MNFEVFRLLGSLIKKDLSLEWRTREIFTSMSLFGLVMIVLIHFSLETASLDLEPLLPGIMWITYLFSGILSLNRTASIEKENHGFEAMLTCAVKPEIIYLGKLLTNLFFLMLTQILFLPLFSVFFNINLFSRIGPLLLIQLVGSLGLATLGTFFSTIGLSVRIRDLFLPLLLFPIIVPLLIGCVETTQLAMNDVPMTSSHAFKLMVAYDVIFFSICFITFEYLLEE